MSVSRRKFLQHGVLTAAACAALPLEGLAQSRNFSENIGDPGERPNPKGTTSQSQGDALVLGSCHTHVLAEAQVLSRRNVQRWPRAFRVVDDDDARGLMGNAVQHTAKHRCLGVIGDKNAIDPWLVHLIRTAT